MAIAYRSGKNVSLKLPKIKVDGVEISATAHNVQKQDKYVYYYRPVKRIHTSGLLTFTSADSSVDLHYTFNGRTPNSKSPKYTGAITLLKNKTGDNTVVKVRAFSSTNSNVCSPVIKATLNVTEH